MQAAACTILANTPGITVAGAVTDPLGRAGTAFDAAFPADASGQSFRLVLADNGKVLSFATTAADGSSYWMVLTGSGYREDLGP